MRMFKGKNLVERKKAEKNIKLIQECNKSSHEFLEALKERYHFSEEELINLNNVQNHLLNMNVLFDSLLQKK